MKIIYELLKIAIGVMFGAGLVIFFNINLHLGSASRALAPEMTYADLAAVNLTVATVVLGGVALIVAVAAVFGFQIIRSESVSNAESRVKQDLPAMVERELARMETDGRLRQALGRVVYSGEPGEDDGSQSAPE